MRSIYTAITNIEYYDCLREDAAETQTNWTISKHARPGDMVILYVCAPVSAIVATAVVSTTPELCEDPNHEWFGSYFADMHSLSMLKVPVNRLTLRQQIHDWRYWRQPRQSIKVPAEYISELERLLSNL